MAFKQKENDGFTNSNCMLVAVELYICEVIIFFFFKCHFLKMSLLNLEQKYPQFERELRTETFCRFSKFIWLGHDTKVP